MALVLAAATTHSLWPSEALTVWVWIIRQVPELRGDGRHGMAHDAPPPGSRANRASTRLGLAAHDFSHDARQQKKNDSTPWWAVLTLLLVIGACMPSPCVSVCEVAPNAVGLVTGLEFALGYTTVNSSAFAQCYSLIAISFPLTLTMISANAFDSATFLTTVCGPCSHLVVMLIASCPT